ncbi:MAG: hypothetical protein ACRDTD_27490 [Pseudonocardiaceae bacterium]
MIQDVSTDPHIPLITSVPTESKPEAARAFIDRQHARLTRGEGYSFPITDLASGQALGQIGLCRRGSVSGTSRDAPVDDASDMLTPAAPRDRLVAEPPLEVPIVTTSNAGHPAWPGGSRPSVDELFRDTEPVRCAEDLAREGIFAEGEVEEFLADLYAMRRSDVG